MGFEIRADNLDDIKHVLTAADASELRIGTCGYKGVIYHLGWGDDNKHYVRGIDQSKASKPPATR